MAEWRERQQELRQQMQALSEALEQGGAGAVDPRAVYRVLGQFHNVFVKTPEGMDRADGIVGHAMDRFGVGRSMNPDLRKLGEIYRYLQNDCIMLRRLVHGTKLQAWWRETFSGDAADATDPLLAPDALLQRTCTAVAELYGLLNAEQRVRGCLFATGTEVLDAGDPTDRFRYSQADDDLTPFQELIIFLGSELHKDGYRRFQREVWGPLRTPEGVQTPAWQRVCSVPEYVNAKCGRWDRYAQWKNLTGVAANRANLIRHFEEALEPDFPELRKNYAVRAFRNGVLSFDYEPPPGLRLDELEALPWCHWYPYDGAGVPPDLVACKYYDQDFDTSIIGRPLHTIPTPTLTHILTYQQIDERTQAAVKLHAGRMLYPLNRYDRWQVMLFVLGVAGSGKSTLLKAFADFYDAADVGVLSSNMEEKFGLSAILGKACWFCYEVKKKFALSLSELQCMISGEAVTVAIKNKIAQTLAWGAPGMMAGNEVPPWIDAMGALVRRLMMLEFRVPVPPTVGDMLLEQRLGDEMGNMLYVCNGVYRLVAYTQQDKNAWAIMPDYFRRTQRNLRRSLVPIADFIESGAVFEPRPDSYVLFEDFKTAFLKFCKDMCIKAANPLDEAQQVVLKDYGIKMERGRWLWKHHETTSLWLVGLACPDAPHLYADRLKK